MNEQEKYLFDLRGYLVVKNALAPAQLADLSDRLEQDRARQERPHYGSDRTRFRRDEDPAWSASSLLEWGGTYIECDHHPCTGSPGTNPNEIRSALLNRDCKDTACSTSRRRDLGS